MVFIMFPISMNRHTIYQSMQTKNLEIVFDISSNPFYIQHIIDFAL